MMFKNGSFWLIFVQFLSISYHFLSKKCKKTLIFTPIFSSKTDKSYKFILFTTTNHPIFQKNLQKPYFSLFSDFFYLLFLHLFCLLSSVICLLFPVFCLLFVIWALLVLPKIRQKDLTRRFYSLEYSVSRI
jgi:hypothetical protein